MTTPLAARLGAALETLFDAHPDRLAGPVGVAVSGGGDSTALLLAARDWARARGWEIRAATVDHGLRPGSDEEARQVAELCARLGCAHRTLRLTDLPPGPNLQARARDARYVALAGWAGTANVGAVLLGHTADDVAETLVMRLGRGAGIDGLSRMSACFGARPAFARPFLDIRRGELRGFLGDHGIEPIEDPSNDDAAFERVRARRAIAELGLDIDALARSASLLGEARQSLERRAVDLARQLAVEDRGDLLFQDPAFQALVTDEPEQARRLLLGALRWIGGNPYPPRGSEITTLLAAATERRICTLGGCKLAWERGRLRIAREAAAVGAPVPVGTIWDGRWQVTGPAAPGMTVGALGADVSLTDWRGTGLPRASLLASPAVRDAGGALVAAPLAGPAGEWTAETRDPFARSLISR